MVEESAIPQQNSKANIKNQGGLAPKIVDPTKNTTSVSYEFPSIWESWLEEIAINGDIIGK